MEISYLLKQTNYEFKNIAGLLLLSSYIPFLKRLIDKIRKKDDKNRVEDVEEKLDDGEDAVSEKIVEGEN